MFYIYQIIYISYKFHNSYFVIFVNFVNLGVEDFLSKWLEQELAHAASVSFSSPKCTRTDCSLMFATVKERRKCLPLSAGALQLGTIGVAILRQRAATSRTPKHFEPLHRWACDHPVAWWKQCTLKRWTTRASDLHVYVCIYI